MIIAVIYIIFDGTKKCYKMPKRELGTFVSSK